MRQTEASLSRVIACALVLATAVPARWRSFSGDTDATLRDAETGAGVHGRAGIEVRASTDRRLRDPQRYGSTGAGDGEASPDPQVNAPLIEALKNWTFQPAQVDGNPVALKILLGIRLAGR
jgi:hypothetical protein